MKRARSWTLLECEINCCTGNNCNTQIPTGAPSANAITVFAPSGNKEVVLVLFNKFSLTNVSIHFRMN